MPSLRTSGHIALARQLAAKRRAAGIPPRPPHQPNSNGWLATVLRLRVRTSR